MLSRVIISAALFCATGVAVEAATTWECVKGLFQKPIASRPPRVRVLIAHDLQGATLEVEGKYKLFNPANHEHLSTRFVGKRQQIAAISDGLRWGEEFPELHQITFVPAEAATKIQLDDIEYLGDLSVYDIGGTISIVNDISIEDLLKHSLPQMYSQELGDELLAAIAIVARTNLYYDREHPRNKFWDVAAAKWHYQGVRSDAVPEAWQKAIDQTRYMVMSSTTVYEKALTPFPVDWQPDSEAIALAERGQNAAQILAKAFPKMNMQIAYQPNQPNQSNQPNQPNQLNQSNRPKQFK